jgi:hypothetical protein
VWDAQTSSLLWVLNDLDYAVKNAVFAPDSQHVFASSTYEAVVFDLPEIIVEPAKAPVQEGTP